MSARQFRKKPDATADPMVWAEALADVIRNGADPDEGLLVGWFSNYAHAIDMSRRD